MRTRKNIEIQSRKIQNNLNFPTLDFLIFPRSQIKGVGISKKILWFFTLFTRYPTIDCIILVQNQNWYTQSVVLAKCVPEIQLLSAWSGLKASQTSFFGKLLEYLMIFQSSTAPPVLSTLKNHKMWQKFVKKMKKRLVQLGFKF